MKTRTFAVALAPLLALHPVAAQQEPEQERPPALELQLEQTLGRAEGERPYVFGGIRRIAVAESGEIVVVDRLDLLFRVYDAAGVFQYAFDAPRDAPRSIGGPDLVRMVDGNVQAFDLATGILATYSLAGAHVSDEVVVPENAVRTTRAAPLRFGWLIGTTGVSATDSIRFVLQAAAGHRADTIATWATGWVLRNRPNLGLMSPVLSLGPGADWAAGGDSLVVTVNAYNGAITWYRADPSGLARLRERDLEWTPVPIRREETAEIQRRVRELHEIPGGEAVSVRPPQYFGRVARVLLDDRGRAWIRLNDRYDLTNEWRIVGRSPDQDARVTVPDGFLLHAVVGNRLYGAAQSGDGVWRVIIYRAAPAPN